MKSSRIVLVSLFALASASAFAAPKVGDSATLDGTLVGQGINAKVTTSQTVTAFNANSGVYTVHQVQTIAGQSQAKDVNVASDDMMSEETAALIVQFCESQSLGKKERITVAAGTFDTCRVPGNAGSTIWVAPVPFGMVKLSSPLSIGTVDLGMTSFTRGQ